MACKDCSKPSECKRNICCGKCPDYDKCPYKIPCASCNPHVEDKKKKD